MGYDANLVRLLYDAAAQNASFSKVTFFTTSLSPLAVIGYYPQSAMLQHHGVQLTLSPDAVRLVGCLNHSCCLDEKSIPPDPPFITPGASVVTIEMMSEGLL